MFRRNQRPQKPKKQQKRDPKPNQQHSPNNSSPPGATSSTTSTGAPSSGSAKPPSNSARKPPSSRGSNNISKFGPLGGLLPLAAASGKLSCPPVIVAMRSAIAGLKPVRQLRPQTLPIRSLAMASTAILANVPCGMWREHTKKFSPEWFVAVHATIPFVAMLRKAVLMPRWAILLTVAGSIAGQQLGAKLEKARLRRRRAVAASVGGSSSTVGNRNVFVNDFWQRCGTAVNEFAVKNASRVPQIGSVA